MLPWAHPSSQLNRISIGSAVFAGLTTVTDRRTYHATRYVTIGRIYVRSTAMRPNKNEHHNVCGADIVTEPLQEFTRFI